MSYTYAHRKKGETAPIDKAAESAQPSPDALRSGMVRPTREQLGRRVDLPDAIREKMETSFGTDLSAVRLYESKTVADAGAEAVAQGSNIAFAPGMLDFTSFGGQALLGHEISHVVSQSRGEVNGDGFLNDRSLEARADREGALAAAGRTVAMPENAVSSADSASAAGPMQARKAKSKGEMLADDFDQNTGAKTVRRNPGNKEGFSGLNNLAFKYMYGSKEERTTPMRQADSNISGMGWVYNRKKKQREYKRRFAEAKGASVESSKFQNQANQNNIEGNIYRPAPGNNNGKSVLIYSGSGGTAQDQVGGDINQYLRKGYTVYSYDYGGFGNSKTPDGKLSEESMQQDAQAMLEHVNSLGVNNEDLLLHGFSMGGNMASHVARNAAIKAAKSGDKKDRLSGMVLESSMKNTSHAGGILGPLASPQGEFDTTANLKELAALDPDMPINLISGAKGDFLSLKSTGLEKLVRSRFKNVASNTVSDANHMSPYKLMHSWKKIKNNLHRSG